MCSFYKYVHLIEQKTLIDIATNKHHGIHRYMKKKTGKNNRIIRTFVIVNQIYLICGFYGAIRCVTLWMDEHIIPIIKEISQNATKIQRFIKNYQCRKRIKDIRHYKYLNSKDKVRMAFYATMHDSRCIMNLSHEEKMQVSIFVWMMGIIKDDRVYHRLPEEIKNNPDVGLILAKTLIRHHAYRLNNIPGHIQTLILPEIEYLIRKP